MNSSALNQLFHLAGNQQNYGRINIHKLLEDAQAAQIDVSISDLQIIIQRYISHMTSIQIYPEWLIEFIVEYLKGSTINSILDPWASSLLLISLTQLIQPDLSLGFAPYQEVIDIAPLLSPHTSITWINKDFLAQPLTSDKKFDVITSRLPNTGQINITLASSNGPVTIKDDRGAIIVLQSCTRLTQNGVALFVVTNNFTKLDKPYSVYSNLSQFDLYVDAALALPGYTLDPRSSMASTLVIIKRGKANQLFIGELSTDQNHNTQLLKNLKAHKTGPELSLGTLIDSTDYYGYKSLVSQRKVHEMIKKMGIKTVQLSEIALQINVTKATEYPGFQEIPNAIYIPLIGHSKVVSSLAQATLKRPFNYIQIVLDPNKAVALYVANFFNTKLGQWQYVKGCVKYQRLVAASMLAASGAYGTSSYEQRHRRAAHNCLHCERRPPFYANAA